MKRASGFRKFVQGTFFPDLDHLLMATEELDRRINLMDKSVGALEKSVGALDKSVDQLDKGMVQLDHGMNRLDKEMIRLNLGVEQVNKGMDQMNKDVDEREKDLTVRLANLKHKLESDHARAMGEVAELLDTHAFAERNGLLKTHTQPDRARAISELSAALGAQSPIEESKGEAEPDRVRALEELAALLGSSRAGDEPVRSEPGRHDLKEDADRYAKAGNGQAAPFDFAAILEHIRNRDTPL
jgi:septal ring factor EnvC (AmiA/AmiB activator)